MQNVLRAHACLRELNVYWSWRLLHFLANYTCLFVTAPHYRMLFSRPLYLPYASCVWMAI